MGEREITPLVIPVYWHLTDMEDLLQGADERIDKKKQTALLSCKDILLEAQQSEWHLSNQSRVIQSDAWNKVSSRAAVCKKAQTVFREVKVKSLGCNMKRRVNQNLGKARHQSARITTRKCCDDSLMCAELLGAVGHTDSQWIWLDDEPHFTRTAMLRHQSQIQVFKLHLLDFNLENDSEDLNLRWTCLPAMWRACPSASERFCGLCCWWEISHTEHYVHLSVTSCLWLPSHEPLVGLLSAILRMDH